MKLRECKHGRREHILLHDDHGPSAGAGRARDDGFFRAHQLGCETGPYLAAATQILNSVGALCLVYAFRYGKAIVVSPLTNAGAPLITAVLSILLLGTVPTATKIAGIALALLAAVFLAIEPEPIADAPRIAQRL